MRSRNSRTLHGVALDHGRLAAERQRLDDDRRTDRDRDLDERRYDDAIKKIEAIKALRG